LVRQIVRVGELRPVLALVTGQLEPVTSEMLVVFALVAVTFVLVVTEPVLVDVTAIALIVALERSGGDGFFASAVVVVAEGYPPIVVLGLFYLVRTLMTELVSNNASVVLMIPVGSTPRFRSARTRSRSCSPSRSPPARPC
jgi:di/tricarboxylate transporter